MSGPETTIASTTTTTPKRGTGSVRLFAGAAWRYWAQVFPAARSTQRRLRELATKIPDPLLREDALISHDHKGSNSEGLAALAVLAPRERRSDVARSLVAYQLMLDYLDCVSERPVENPVEAGLDLHRAFAVALDPDASHEDYYARAPAADDGGYLERLIETCRAPLRGLPSYHAVQGPLQHQAMLCAESQALNHALRFTAVEDRLSEWARTTVAEARFESEFEWWELVAAAAASSLCVGALIALAAVPGVSEEEARRVEAAYFPWASGLNALLDSLVDLDEDPEDGSHLRRYSSPEHAAERLGTIAGGARLRVSALADGALHEAILAAMGALYLAHEEAWKPGREPISLAIYEALGPLAKPSLVVHLLRRGGKGSRALLRARRRHVREAAGESSSAIATPRL
jgi:tetraprenyl-beta-curcumene synthase